MAQKKVMIVMDDKLHKIIKSLANVYDISISELISELVTPGICLLYTSDAADEL